MVSGSSSIMRNRFADRRRPPVRAPQTPGGAVDGLACHQRPAVSPHCLRNFSAQQAHQVGIPAGPFLDPASAPSETSQPYASKVARASARVCSGERGAAATGLAMLNGEVEPVDRPTRFIPPDTTATNCRGRRGPAPCRRSAAPAAGRGPGHAAAPGDGQSGAPGAGPGAEHSQPGSSETIGRRKHPPDCRLRIANCGLPRLRRIGPGVAGFFRVEMPSALSINSAALVKKAASSPDRVSQRSRYKGVYLPPAASASATSLSRWVFSLREAPAAPRTPEPARDAGRPGCALHRARGPS